MKSIKKWFFFALTPFYLFIVYYKMVLGADLEGLLLVSAVLVIVYLPIQVLLVQSEADLSIDSLLYNEDISEYLERILYLSAAWIAFVGIVTLLSFYSGGNVLINSNYFVYPFILIFYILWLRITSKYFDIMAYNAEDINFLKMIAGIFLLIALFFVFNISEVRGSGFTYIISLFATVFKSIIALVFIIPTFFIAMYSSSDINEYGTSSSKSSSFATLSPGFLFFGFILFLMFIEWFSNFVNSFSAYNVALFTSLLMMLISAYATLFQVKIFSGTFLKNREKSEKISVIFITLFYGVMMIHMNFANSIQNSSDKISGFQTSVKSLSNSLQNRFNY